MKQTANRENNYLERNPSPIIIVDLTGSLIYLNQATQDFLGKLGLDESAFPDLLPPNFIDIFQNCKAAAVSIPSTRIEYADRVIIWSSFFSENMQEVMYQGMDITRLHRNELALRAAKEKAEEGEKLKAAFLDNMSHEIRTPLNSLLGFMGLLGDELEGNLSEDQHFYFELIQENGNRLARTMQEILDISHFSSGTYEVKMETIDVGALIKEHTDNTLDQAKAKGLQFLIDLPVQELLATTDPYCLNQTISHLLDNAVKYTLEGHVSVKLQKTDAGTEIRIEDSGPGMDDEMQRSIFMAFNQGSIGHSKQYQGIGLGLSLVRVYLDTIGATVDLDSVIGDGSRFKITIPN